VSDCEVAGGGSGAVGVRHGADHVVGESFAKAPRWRGGRFGLWPLVRVAARTQTCRSGAWTVCE
jgi:hypothetical protein